MGRIQDSIDKATKTVGEAMIISGMSEMSAQSALDSVGATDAPARNKLGAMKQSNKAHDVQKLTRETKMPVPNDTLDKQQEYLQEYKDLDIANQTDKMINEGMTPENLLNLTKLGDTGVDAVNAGLDRYFEKKAKTNQLVDKYMRYQQAMQNKQGHAEVKKAEAQASQTPKQRKKSDPNYTPVTGGMNFD